MFADQGPMLLNAHFGTNSPYWRLTFDSNALALSAVKGKTHMAVALSAMQAAKIRRLSGITASLDITITISGEPIHLHLVGRRINNLEWAGTASAFSDTQSVARDLVHGLSFAEQVVSEANSVIVIVDQHGRIQRFNRLSEEYTGLHEHDVIGKNVFQLFMSPEEASASRRNIAGFFRNGSSYEVERWIKTVKGERLFLFRNKFVHSGSGKNEVFLICSGTDITEERRAQERLRVLANTDIITGLPNRNAIQDKITQSIAARDGSNVGLVYLDLDNFKKVNDAYGHMFGDRLLVEVSLAVLGCLAEDQTLARLGGDEFLVLAQQADREMLQRLAQRIIDRLKTPFRIGLIEVYTGCSIGIALCPEHGNDLDSLIRSADTAMYVAKEHGKRTYTVFSPEMNKRVAEYMWLDTNLRKGLEQNQLVVYYQPKIEAISGKVCSVEALVRWDSPERGLIPPLQFISYAEESGLIGPLGRWVLQTAAKQAAHWQRQGLQLRVAVNLSARQLVDDSIVEDLAQVLLQNQLAPCLLDFELTESSLIEDEKRAREVITRLRELGAQVHLDDFGTGYSSLAQLARIPLDAIKLDKSFVRGVNDNPVSQSLVRAIVAAAEALKFRVIAEGVETESENRFLDEIGVDEKQGFLFARPMLPEQLEHWLQSYRPPSSSA
ncbi:cyclic di-GMP phosphodiesterase [Serratia proteamaculans]|uniref:cyclic-guanylate-specific phosphodiesterase n=1 Tax=Serratia proteamaculans TaxID=28151 RepID=A0A7U0NA22_SERPR|nr:MULTISPECIES: cyclic di-GMP phosphodiesterase [Serratia]HCV64871.1 cyclic di-GMP phosphodiesterase [Serratia sp. (in: enterobacteria)]MBO1505587.1 cyclic di-GMP phosphodiesterase [Serratia proteamaculans]MDW5513349.1 cyclic di-GMP phosphodiesterase [Serratia proteamaculans]QQX55259.1 cyclic di-GMP phosphodiesterase [Serratia proteamaculans]WEO89451.1 cyclic di-GMP phosphodiesterase [Serratia proteamaculans]